MKKYLFSILILFITLASSQAQDSSRLVLIITPRSSIIKLDGNDITKANYKTLLFPKPGVHVLKLWAPNRQLETDTVTLKKDSLSIINIRLAYTPKYVTYMDSLKHYRFVRHTRMLISIMALVAPVLTTREYFYDHNHANVYYSQAISFQASYNKVLAYPHLDVPDLTKYKNEFNSAQSQYEYFRKRNNEFLIIAPSITIAEAVGIYFMVRHHLKKPTLYHEQPLLSLNSLEINPATKSLSLQIRF